MMLAWRAPAWKIVLRLFHVSVWIRVLEFTVFSLLFDRSIMFLPFSLVVLSICRYYV